MKEATLMESINIDKVALAQMHVCSTGDQEVADSIPAGIRQHISWWLTMKYFIRSFTPFRWFKKGSCQFLAKKSLRKYWSTTLRTKTAKEKVC